MGRDRLVVIVIQVMGDVNAGAAQKYKVDCSFLGLTLGLIAQGLGYALPPWTKDDNDAGLEHTAVKNTSVCGYLYTFRRKRPGKIIPPPNSFT
jgi:hypothetical protein